MLLPLGAAGDDTNSPPEEGKAESMVVVVSEPMMALAGEGGVAGR